MTGNIVFLFKASNLKVARAKQHIGELGDILAKHAIDHPPQSTFIPASEGKNAQINTTTFSPPMSVGAVVGDIVHNLRAALDLMAVEIVSIVPGGNTRGVYFPFCDNGDDLDLIIKRRNFHRAGQDAVDMVKSLKPYRGGNVALRALHDLDLQDKHHTLIATAASMGTPEMTVDVSDFPNSVKIVPVEGSLPTVAIVFPNDSPLAGEKMIPALHMLVELIESILESFAGLIAARA